MNSVQRLDRSPARLIGGLVALVALAALTVASVLSLMPPAPKAADAPMTEFSATRAFADVQTIGQRVRVTGSAAAAQVREHIVTTLDDLGYHPQVREGIGETDALGGPAVAHVQNVMAEIPGTASTGRLILMAHYDSVQVSYGANDDGSGVATLLETARALTNGPKLKNDVILLFTDAEEACLCGAESFVHSDPLGVDGGVVLNFESRGANGPSIMFETASGNANLIDEYARAVPYPVATSMAVEVYRILPNDTDFTPFRLSGRFTGLNSAYIDGSAVYHSPEDRPEYMDRGTLQAQGSNALALTRQLGDADLVSLAHPAGHDATYFPVLGTLIRYPGTLVWPLAILGLVAVIGLAAVVRRRARVGWGRLVAGFGLMAVPLIGAAVVAQLFWMLLVAIRPAYAPMIDPWRPTWFRFAVVALVAAVVIGWYALWRKRFTPWGLAVGGLTWLGLLGVVMAAATPSGSYLASLPALSGAAAGIVAVASRRWWVRLTAMTVSGAIAVLILAPTVVLFFPALGLATGAAGALMAAMLGLALPPVIEHLHPALRHASTTADTIASGDASVSADVSATAGASDSTAHGATPTTRPRRLSAAAATLVATVLAVACAGIGLATDTFDARHPKPTQLMYALDVDAGQAFWASQQTDPTGYLKHYITGTRDLSAEFPLLHGAVASGPATAADLPAPDVTVESSAEHGATRTVTFTVQSLRAARLIDLDAPDITVTRASVRAGNVSRDLPIAAHGFGLLFHAPPADGITVTLEITGSGPATIRVMDGSDGLTGLPGFVPRPSGVGVQGSHTSELVLVAHTATV